MIPIIKGHEPDALAKAKRAIRSTPDTTFSYEALRKDYKQDVLKALVAEQGRLCAYCMCRIGTPDHPATIEHLVPQHPTNSDTNGELSLDYHNMVAVCDGRDGVTCDKRRGNTPLTVNPTKPQTLKTIFYHRDGSIDATDAAVRNDLQETLGLNDSSTYLCINRASAIKTIERVIKEKITHSGIENNREAKKKICLKVLAQYENQTGEKDEFLGAMLFKARKLVSKFAS